MPTGYTCRIKDGISFYDFMLICARAMGACITMREDSMDTEIPEVFLPSDHHNRGIQEYTAELKKYTSMSNKEIKKIIEVEYKDRIKYINEKWEENTDLLKKYNEMLTKVQAWKPPTANHIKFKEFMVSQITESRDHDCMLDYWAKELASAKKKTTVSKWKSSKTKSCKDSIKYHTIEYKAEVKRAKDRTKWVQELRNSLKKIKLDN